MSDARDSSLVSAGSGLIFPSVFENPDALCDLVRISERSALATSIKFNIIKLLFVCHGPITSGTDPAMEGMFETRRLDR